MQDAGLIQDGFVLVREGLIADAGPMSQLNLAGAAGAEVIDCRGRILMPGFCDSHTHLVFARTRESEFVDRIRGLSYEEIARRGGGILNSAKRLQATSEEELLMSALGRAREILSRGTTSVEIKSGYGLTLADEIKMLRVARQLATLIPQQVRTTFLGAHAIPAEYKSRREDYLSLVTEEMLPRVAEEGLADFIDVFCDTGFFTVEETAHILECGARFGLRGKIHANELDFSGGVQVGVAHRALSVDHLERSGAAEIEALRGSDTMPTVLPGCSFFLRIPYAPARELIDAGLPLAAATDYNPGSSPSGSIPFVMSLLCTQARLLPEEALCAVTLNGAYAMGLESGAGSIAPGKRADLVLSTPLESLARIPYSFTAQAVDRVWVAGREVVREGATLI